MNKLMLIDASHPEETRVVVTDDGLVQEFDFVSAAKAHVKGNIYLAKITRVEPSLQAAFVDYGMERQGFLPFSEIHPDYYQIPVADRKALMAEDDRSEKSSASQGDDYAQPDDISAARGDDALPQEAASAETVQEGLPPLDEPADDAAREADGKAPRESAEPQAENGQRPERAEVTEIPGEDEEARPARRYKSFRRYKIQEVIKRGQIVLVQVIKEERGNKGAALSTYISLPGRYSVLMPNTPDAGGVSRKIADSHDRKRLKEISDSLEVPEGMSVIIRTNGSDRSKTEIRRDYDYMIKLWSNIRERTLSSYAPSMVYEEGDIIKRSIRDLYHSDIDEILVDGEEGHKTAKDMMRMLMPSHAAKVKINRGTVPLFYQYEIEEQLFEIHDPVVRLQSGGYVVINQTEALVAIDVNSGRATAERNIEETATKTNLEAAREIARQLKLRDMAGLIVIDFIDMGDSRNRKAVEKALKDALKTDRAKVQIGRISAFGLLELSRQRLRPSLNESVMVTCPHCEGRGIVRSVSSLALMVLRSVESEAAKQQLSEVKITCVPEVALYLLNEKRAWLADIETRYGIRVIVAQSATLSGNAFETEMRDINGSLVETKKEVRRTRRGGRRGRGQGGGGQSGHHAHPRFIQDEESGSAEPQERERDHDRDRDRDRDRDESEGDGEGREGRRRGRRRNRRRGGRRRSEPGTQTDMTEDGVPADGEGRDESDGDAREVPAGDDASAEDKPRRERGGRRSWRKDREPAAAVEASEVSAEAAAEVVPVPVADQAADADVDADAPAEAAKERRPRRAARPRAEKPHLTAVPDAEAEEPRAQPRASAAKPAAAAAGATAPAAAPEPVSAPAVAVAAVPAAQPEAPEDVTVDDTPEDASRPKRRGWWGKIIN